MIHQTRSLRTPYLYPQISSLFRAKGVCSFVPMFVGTKKLEKIPTKVILDWLKRNMSRGKSLSDELDLSSVLGDTRAYLYSAVLG